MGLQQRILEEEEPRAYFVHCSAHNLNHVDQDGIERVRTARKFVGEVKDMINIVRDSPKQVTKFQDLQTSESFVRRYRPYSVCSTRWVVRIESLKTVDNVDNIFPRAY